MIVFPTSQKIQRDGSHTLLLPFLKVHFPFLSLSFRALTQQKSCHENVLTCQFFFFSLSVSLSLLETEKQKDTDGDSQSETKKTPFTVLIEGRWKC